MRSIGLIGGISPISTVYYYESINKLVNQSMGKLHGAKLVLISVDFNPIAEAMAQNRWDDIADIMVDAANQFRHHEIDAVAICSNSLHKVSKAVAAAVHVPLLSIIDSTGFELKRKNFKKIGLLGTTVTMEDTFYTDSLINGYGVDVLTLPAGERKRINEIIFTELCHGKISDDAKRELLDACYSLHAQGAEAIILGCTELPLFIVDDGTYPFAIIDTTSLHIKEIVSFLIASDNEERNIFSKECYEH